METNKIHEITFDTDETIVAAALSGPNELVMLMSSGRVIRYKIKEQASQFLFSIKSNIEYPDGGFDIGEKSSIYTLNEIVVLVNDFKRHGFIHYPGKYRSLHLWREDYHADISCYPIALFENEAGVPHIIYGEAWNHIQIMNLDTRQVLTASKSLIEEDAEERHIAFYKKYSEDNKLPWPRPYDYFYGKLHISPNKKRFLSAGWGWGSSDAYNVYDIGPFISSNRIASIGIGYWEHENRAVCWLNDETIAIGYHPFTEGDEGSTADSPCEIHFYKIFEGKAAIEKRIKITDLDVVHATMVFDKKFNCIIVYSDKTGLAVLSMDGGVLFHDNNLRIDEYWPESGLALKTNNKTVTVYEIKE